LFPPRNTERGKEEKGKKGKKENLFYVEILFSDHKNNHF